MTAPVRILVIEDEPAIADTLVYALRTEGFAPEWCATGREGLAAFSSAATMADNPAAGFALVILDVGLPDMSGFDLCRELRTRTPVPVLFLTARSSEIDRVVGLELGGDDYVTKPFSPREVTARVRAILRRTHPPVIAAPAHNSTTTNTATTTAPSLTNETQPVCNVLSYKPAGGAPGAVGLTVNEECKEAFFCGVRLELTRYEFRLLAVLHSRPGRVWSRDELMTRVWEDPGASLDRTVDAHIKTLRGKLRSIASEPDVICTHRGEGYSLRLLS
ncbi:winged helix-turn-helix domain-containing protein [Rariglobus hedericola]|uniref:Response regulator n=1 Tax=Rariglobus hedericola TaxID=2597822 RepID=A0A556QK15_9BACT|nr:winged helix-turn-helix domain-containing protein [Rariglobus hedericola]TSJ76993.1 response regulator [Rariglobus hedericola]